MKPSSRDYKSVKFETTPSSIFGNCSHLPPVMQRHKSSGATMEIRYSVFGRSLTLLLRPPFARILSSPSAAPGEGLLGHRPLLFISRLVTENSFAKSNKLSISLLLRVASAHTFHYYQTSGFKHRPYLEGTLLLPMSPPRSVLGNNSLFVSFSGDICRPLGGSRRRLSRFHVVVIPTSSASGNVAQPPACSNNPFFRS